MDKLQRLKTYVAWPRNIDSISPIVLANAGFIYKGQGDIVACPVCRIEIQGWSSDTLSHPRNEHITRSPRCSLALECFQHAKETTPVPVKQSTSNFTTSSLENPDGTNQERSNSDRSFPLQQATCMMMLSSCADDHVDKCTNLAKTGSDIVWPIDRNRPDFDRLLDENLRLTTYFDWPPAFYVKPVDLAANGFFYTGQKDRVQCAFCRGKLHNWANGDVPASEHRRHFPNCPFVRGHAGIQTCAQREKEETKMTGEQMPTLGNVQQLPNKNRKDHKSFDDSATRTSSLPWNVTREQERNPRSDPAKQLDQAAMELPSTSADEREEEFKLLEERNRLIEIKTCKVCMAQEFDTVFLPCGHLVSCRDCAPKLRNCPVCRCYIRGTVKTFFA